MRERVGIVLAICLYNSGLIRLARWWMQRSGPHLIILNYHRATNGDLRQHLLYLRRHYRMLHLEEALEELYHQPKKTCGQDQRTALVLTFDDGYNDNYTCAFALARELQIPITIFLIPGYIESGERFWWLEGEHLACETTVEEVRIDGRTYHPKQLQERDRLAQAIDTQLRYASSVTERNLYLRHIRKCLAYDPSSQREQEGLRPLSWEQVREMEDSGWVSFGAHTMHHPILAYLKDPEEVYREVSECRHTLEHQIGHPVRTFAYPVGRTHHVGKLAVEAVQKAGYEWAVTTMHGIDTPQSNPYLLGRVLGDVSRHWMVMAAEVSGVWKWFSLLWKNALFGDKGKSL